MALAGTLVSLFVLVSIYAILSLGLNVKFGYAGLLDIGHVLFYMIGAYMAALLVLPPSETFQFSEYILGLNWPWIVAIPIAIIAAGIAGMLVALPAIRLREDYLAITVLGLSIIGLRIVQSESWLANGPNTLAGFTGPLNARFPLPKDTLVGIVLVGIIVFIFWTFALYILANITSFTEATTWKKKLLHVLLLIATLGLGYGVVRYIHRSEVSMIPVILTTGFVYGIIASGLVFLGLGQI
ncbi:MAG: hypothetical protein ABEI86_10055, partial [Halobacteriaceae archaeon]